MSDRIDILLIEDEPNIAEAVSFILKREGWEVSSLADGAAAIAEIRRLAPRLLILDLVLPGRSGQEILADLRADADPRLAATPVLLMTAQGQEPRDSVVSGRPAPAADAALSKPFANDDLRALVQQMLG